MHFRVSSTGPPPDPLSFALGVAEEHAAAAGAPFTEAELWPILSERGLYLEEGGARLPSSPETDARGVFAAKLALDYLFAQRRLKRDLNRKGDYVYSRG